ncbi:MAG: hypothetical protein Q7J34_07380, partial [Bacteroidales bacterium]|nr:hypothetical protein [Bacteroidales bacterium]
GIKIVIQQRPVRAAKSPGLYSKLNSSPLASRASATDGEPQPEASGELIKLHSKAQLLKTN